MFFQVQLGRHLDPMTVEGMIGLFKQFGRLQQCFGRNAADIQAGPAERPAHFHAGSFHAQLCCANGCYIAARPTTDYDQIEFRIRHSSDPFS